MDVETVTVEQLIDRAADLARGRRRLLGIAGAPGAGKSTLAEAIVAALRECAVYVPMDGFHLDDAVLHRHGSLDRKGAIDTFDGAGYAHLLARLRAQRPGEVIYAPWFDRSREAAIAGVVEIAATVPLIVTEGNYLLAEEEPWPTARACLNEVWFLDLDAPTRRRRLTDRHREHGRGPVEAARRALGPDEANARTIIAHADRADRVVRF